MSGDNGCWVVWSRSLIWGADLGEKDTNCYFSNTKTAVSFITRLCDVLFSVWLNCHLIVKGDYSHVSLQAFSLKCWCFYYSRSTTTQRTSSTASSLPCQSITYSSTESFPQSSSSQDNRKWNRPRDIHIQLVSVLAHLLYSCKDLWSGAAVLGEKMAVNEITLPQCPPFHPFCTERCFWLDPGC